MAINSFVLADPSCISSNPAFKNTIEKVLEKSGEAIEMVRSAASQVKPALIFHMLYRIFLGHHTAE